MTAWQWAEMWHWGTGAEAGVGGFPHGAHIGHSLQQEPARSEWPWQQRRRSPSPVRGRVRTRTLKELVAMAPRAENAMGVKSMDDSGALAAAECLDSGVLGCRNRRRAPLDAAPRLSSANGTPCSTPFVALDLLLPRPSLSIM